MKAYELRQFNNFGDVNFINDGGVQLQYDKQFKSFDLYKLDTPECWDQNKWIVSTNDVSITELYNKGVWSKDAESIASFIGMDLNKRTYCRDKEETIFDMLVWLAIGWIDYYGSANECLYFDTEQEITKYCNDLQFDI